MQAIPHIPETNMSTENEKPEEASREKIILSEEEARRFKHFLEHPEVFTALWRRLAYPSRMRYVETRPNDEI